MKGCSSCGPTPTSNIENAVKKTYGQLWSEEKGKDSCCLGTPHLELLQRLSLRNGMKVLDIGSGSGETVLALAEKVKPDGKAVGVDFSPEGITVAKEKARKRNLSGLTEFHLANAKELPFANNYFDAVMSECVVCLIQDKQKVLNEKVRVLKPGGKLVMHDVIAWSPMPKYLAENDKMYCGCVGGAVSMDEYVDMMKKAGLTNIETVDFTDESKWTRASILAWALEIEDDKRFQEVVDFVRKGGIGYALFSGIKA